jgi:hypothetical protein
VLVIVKNRANPWPANRARSRSRGASAAPSQSTTHSRPSRSAGLVVESSRRYGPLG